MRPTRPRAPGPRLGGATMSPLRELREERLLTQEALAAKAGVAESAVSRIERGAHRPRFGTIARLAAALGLDPRELRARLAEDWEPRGREEERRR